ncbi:alpha-hydroxy acid oxidase [Amycolatopsis pithecellobii]|uniref:Alpha-hydroxy-acid oxidizing protein n=1 Tax=Amycolatopsis pithecellobii TaxID=664692 RepID=A0A6N7YI25_9PSEU|nr:alpha-hydroxy acid oxidase [Amycolatopsis pithecellobii]MTD52545.1 alpha-hydroxy-acid oxidizing protein [Amycolatopsis pithecellobii]
MPAPNNFGTWRAGARARLPRFAFDFADGGADDEITLRRNQTAFDDLSLIPRVLRGIEHASTERELFGRRLRVPVLPAPTGDSRILGPQAELAQARGASAAGTVSVLSAVASLTPDRVAAAVDEPQWAQLFLYRDREVTQAAVDRLKRLGFSALVLTVDGPVKGNRERDIRNGFRLPLRPTVRMALRNIRHGKWMWDYFTTDPGSSAERGLRARLSTLLENRRRQALSVPAVFNVDQNWDDLKWLRGIWDGPLLLKGVMCAEDADLALELGCDGVIVSNHGGRELDGLPASIEVLPEIAAGVAGRAPILLDGGIRRGTDVVKALSLGATACLVGRPWLYALAVGGTEGVQQMLDAFRGEILSAMQLLGVTKLEQLGPEFVRRRAGTGLEPPPSRP